MMFLAAALVLLPAAASFQAVLLPSFHRSLIATKTTQLCLQQQPIEQPSLDSQSSSGVSYQDVSDGLDRLYPPSDLSQRNALSRTDGYWPYIKDGEEPPMGLTYGEFDLPFFADILEKAIRFVDDGSTTWDGKTFCDIGSGTGRLVIGAAALHPGFRLCRGVEYLQGCHDFAVRAVYGQCRKGLAIPGDNTVLLPMAPIELDCASIGDPNLFIGDVDIAFVFSSAMPADLLEIISQAVGRQCKPGTILVSTDYKLPDEGLVDGKAYRLQLLDKMDASCWCTGGMSTAYFYKVGEANIWRPTPTPARTPGPPNGLLF